MAIVPGLEFAQANVDEDNSRIAAEQARLASAQLQLDSLVASGQLTVGTQAYFDFRNQNLTTSFLEALQGQLATDQQALTASQAASAQASAAPPTQDTAQASISNQDAVAADAAATDPNNQVTTQEQVNLDAPNYNAVQPGGYDPNSDYYTGGGYSEVPSALDVPTSTTTSEVTAAGDTVTTTTTGGTVNVAGGAPNSTTPDSAPKGPIMNPLHSYPSYTYGLSLALMTPEEYNDVVNTQQYTSNRVIIASAGRYNGVETVNNAISASSGAFARAKYFDADFYFENLNIKTVIGMNETTRGTNAIDLSFNIIEPFGVTLFNRIIHLCTDLKIENYAEAPYMLQIDFFASNDAGEIVGVIPGQTKRIPIRLQKFDIKITNKGAEYACVATPYGHSAFEQSVMTTPAHFEVLAGTVDGFFKSNEAELALINSVNQREAAIAQNNQNIAAANQVVQQQQLIGSSLLGAGVQTQVNTTNQVNTSLLASSQQASVAGDPVYRVKSYGTAINAWQKELAKNNKQGFPDVYQFNFHPDIAGANFKLSGKLSPKDAAMADVDDTISIRQGNTGKETDALNYNTKIFSINTGTSIDQVINYVIRNSSYVQDQLVVPEEFTDPTALADAKKKNANLPFKWFKIIPKVTVDHNSYDPVRKAWARTYTYNVIPHEIYNTKLPTMPQGQWTDPVKAYKYYYTGKNVDILSVDIEFNYLYYNAVTAYKNSIANLAGVPTNIQDQQLDAAVDGIPDPANAIQPNRIKPQVLDARARATGGEITPRAAASVDAEQSVYSQVGGDMINLNMKIIGDPQFIKQDDIFYAPGSLLDPSVPALPTQDPRLIADGSLQMDNREVYCQFQYLTPSDIDENTGLMSFDSYSIPSLFNGMFKIQVVESTFSGGKFEQTLEMYRLTRQASLDYLTASDPNNNARTDTAPLPGAASITPTSAVAPNFSTGTSGATGDIVAPNSTPVADQQETTATPTSTDLASVVDTAPTSTIGTQTTADAGQVSAYADQTNNPQTVSEVQATTPSADKLALKATVDQTLADRNTAQAAANSALDSITALQASLDRHQATIDRANARVASGAMSQADANALIAQEQSAIAQLTTMISDKQSQYATLDAANKSAQTAYVNALDAYSRAA